MATLSESFSEWRPTSQLVMALGANSKSGQMLREARGLRSALRRRLVEGEPCVEPRLVAEFFY